MASYSKIAIWKLWLARNDLIFNNRSTKPKIVAAKEKAMLLEAVGNPIQIDPSIVEYRWIDSLQPTKYQKESGKPLIKPKWQMRHPRKEFSEWWKR